VALTKAEMKYLQSLVGKKGRRGEHRFLAEGVRLLEEALAADYLPLSVFYAPSELGRRGETLIRRLIARKVTAQTISVRECGQLADTKTSQGVIALFEQRRYTLAQQLQRGWRRVLICDGVGDPGNLGTLIRSAAAFGFDLMVTTTGTTEAVNPKVIRSSMGAFFRVPVVGGVDDGELAAGLKRAGYTIYSADVRGKPLARRPAPTEKVALVIGSEAAGAGRTLSAKADHCIKIPMSDKVESLNSAMAGTILMFWINGPERISQ
jgi:TrmH family RNA methyltransferase